ncbi:beta-1,3-galactosyltransferase 1-like [Hyperolius riggenbachi]|uniref:beta-1,3-galactosyltransferase 1-like n=1 Tax=Hyperolius riggenbachi TaxID=752182 RepID=UPI0035A284A4
MVDYRFVVRFCNFLALILMIVIAYLFHIEKQTLFVSISLPKGLSRSQKPQEEPVNNLTYPAFRHPLAPPYPYPYKFLINQPDKCKHRRPFLILLVIGKIHDWEARQTIRETWGNESNYDVDVLRIFLVGITNFIQDRTQWMIEEESVAFGDIIQQDFMDTYYNLTLKTLMGMEWVTKFCNNASYVVKIDNDMFLNVECLIYKLLRPDLPLRVNYFTGHIVSSTGPFRSQAYKWYVPREVYPNDTYPPYCSGPGYVFSADLAKKIYNVSQRIRVIPMEDCFMGICLYELHIPLTPSPWGLFFGRYLKYDRCKFHKLITVHHYKNYRLRSIWPDFWNLKSTGCN